MSSVSMMRALLASVALALAGISVPPAGARDAALRSDDGPPDAVGHAGPWRMAIAPGSALDRLLDSGGLRVPSQYSARIRPSQWSPPPRGRVVYAGYECTVDGMHPWSVRSPDDDELIFEVRPGDRLYNPETRYRDPETSERAEVSFPSARWPNGVPVRITYEFLLPSGFDFDSRWTVIGQMHASLNASPSFEFAFRSGSGLNQLKIVTRSGPASRGVEVEHAVGRGTFPRDVWHRVRLEAKMGPDGYLVAWINDEKVVDLSGTVGYDEQKLWYWRMGIYRRAVNTTYRVHYRRFEMSAL